MPDAEDLDLGTQLRAEQETNLFLQETVADLELALEDQSWQRITTGGPNLEFSGAARKMIVDLCRSITIVNPLVKRGVMLRISYIWGGGVQVTARDEKVQEVVAQFWEDNQSSLSGSQAQEELERSLATDGNVYLAAFTSPLTGRVRVRSTPTDEICDIISNPEDRDEPWFYIREYTRVELTDAGETYSEAVRTAHPALGYSPAGRKRPQINGADVKWDAPMLHVSVNRLDGWKFGVPDVYASMAWARAYKDFLTDWALLTKSLAKFAWKLTGDSKTRANKAIEKIRSSVADSAAIPNVTQANTAGQVAGMSAGTALEAIPKSGANIDAGSGKPLAAMVASGLGVPATLLLADPGITGARAVAETLDQPMALEMGLRRMLWQGQVGELLDYVIDQSAIAPKGALKGTVTRDDWDRQVVELAGNAERTVDWDWPELAKVDPVQLITAITTAAEFIPSETTTRLLLTTLGVKDVDEIMDEMKDPAGNFVPPQASVGQAAVDAYNRGEDPAAAVRGGPTKPKTVAAKESTLGVMEPELEESDRVYHWKHGWIPLDHVASDEAMANPLRAGEKVSWTPPGRSESQHATVVNPDAPLGIHIDLGYKQAYVKNPEDLTRHDPVSTPQLKKVEAARIRLVKANDQLSRAQERRKGRIASDAEAKLRAKVTKAQADVTALEQQLNTKT